MDVHCTTCNEPWDTYHLRPDAIFETGLSHEEAKGWGQKLTPRIREEFKAAGWEFGRSVINVIKCPSCPKGAKPDAERLETKALLESLLGGDDDGLAATYEDHKL